MDQGTMGNSQRSDSHEARRIFDRYVKPVEQAHQGEYVLVTPGGETIFAPTLLDHAPRRCAACAQTT